ncbi:grasp-with-spasm system SPASM domain peptide maturase [Prevotella koreensis]|uniref:Grasp-with-spasm system SPASM domain peptide maturase n=1 Tax=Prevotella koreensis TaxID=2490854 RepID=A0A432LMI7_9BACT|nr:grasp-with-spasm system SPASM domain peptide maturase [Prevotella koreensis]
MLLIFAKRNIPTKFLYPFNDGIHIDSIIDFEKLEFAVPEVSENASSIEDKQTLQSYSSKDFEDIKNMYLLIFHDVIISKGRNQSILYDLSEKRLFKVPNSVIEFITILGNKTIGEILNSFSTYEKRILFSYVQFLLSNKLARLVNNVEQFGSQEQFIKGFKESLNISTSIIDSAIIDIKETSSFDIQGFIKKLTSFRCSKILLRFWEINMDFFKKAISCIRTSNSIVRVDTYLPMEMYSQIVTIIENECKLFNILVFRCDKSSISFINPDIIDLRKTIYKSTKQSLAPTDCGNISFGKTALIPRSDYILKNIFVNSCLYKKISVDSDGFVKNCPSMRHHFGHVDSVDLCKVIKENSFTKYWYITKDKINICSICQYKYSCFDCRAYTEDDTLYGRPSKCQLSTSSNQWKK